MRDVTAILMGDPAARFVRVPTPAEVERTRYADTQPAAKCGQGHGNLTPFGLKVRAMNVGDKLIAPSRGAANGLASQMNDQYGWFISCRTVQLKGGARAVEMTRVR